jgi:hypothetical protein
LPTTAYGALDSQQKLIECRITLSELTVLFFLASGFVPNPTSCHLILNYHAAQRLNQPAVLKNKPVLTKDDIYERCLKLFLLKKEDYSVGT